MNNKFQLFIEIVLFIMPSYNQKRNANLVTFMTFLH